MRRALDDDAAADVPCGGCTACCTSSQFVHIGPDESGTLARVPAELQFPAPGLPDGHVVLGYDERGHCPMLVDGACSIYAHRPRTCRTYDCRVFPAAGVELDDDDKSAIAAQARRWEFDLTTEADRTLHAAVRAAASYVRDRDDVDPNATRLAVLAIELHAAFVGTDDADPEAVGRLLAAARSRS
jgi:Fe-S-cluster containining protein